MPRDCSGGAGNTVFAAFPASHQCESGLRGAAGAGGGGMVREPQKRMFRPLCAIILLIAGKYNMFLKKIIIIKYI